MSKSLGTGIDPLDLIDEHGADGTRFGLLAMSSTQDVRFSDEKVAQGRQLANKLFNASRLVLLRVPDGVDAAGDAPPEPQTVEDAWILSRLQRAKADTARAIEAFEFHRAALGLYDFVYGELCDWYLEIVKPRLYADDDDGVGAFALHVLAETLAIAHPVIPFVTEEIWSHIPGADGLLMARRWPAADDVADRPGGGGRARRARSPPCRSCAAGATASAPRPAAVLPARLEARGLRAHRARTSRGWRACAWSADGGEPAATVAVPGGAVAVLPSDAVDLEAAAARASTSAAAWLDAEIARAETQARPTRASWPRRPRRSSQAERDKLARLREERARAVTLERSRRPRSTCSGSSCSACASASSGCAACSRRSARRRSASRAIHVVGTNGKSSTVRMTAALLEAHGVRAGRVPLAAPDELRRAHPDRRRATSSPDAFGAAVQRAAAAAAKVDRGARAGATA